MEVSGSVCFFVIDLLEVLGHRFYGASRIVNEQMTVKRRKATLALLRLENVTKDTIRTITHRIEMADVSSPSDLEELLGTEPTCIGRHTKEQFVTAWNAAERTESRCKSLGIEVIARWEEKFPKRLLSIHDCPSILFVKGNLNALNSKISVAIIGTREPTPFGEGSAVRIAEFFTHAGASVVSGLARGCDTLAHKGCLRQGGETVAVLAHGLDQVYPPENADLARLIIEKQGCLISEYAPGTRPTGLAFVERDRLQSGLSDAVIVVETGVKGGTLHTANYCLQQGRLLAAIAHPEKYRNAEKAQGNKMLINKRGALAISDRKDLEQKILPFLLECMNGQAPSDSWKREQQLRMQLT